MALLESEPLPQAETGQVTFGALLRQYRLAVGLSQEALAERAGLSAQAMSAWENGRRQAPYRHTVTLLARALGLSAAETAALEATVTRVRTQADAGPATVPALPEREAGAAPQTPAQEDRTTASAPDLAAAATPVAQAAALPTGTITFLLTDIEGSTALWEQHPAAMQTALARHDALVEEVLARHDGRLVKERGEGDSLLVVFTSPSAALAAVCALQQALLAEPWPPQTPLRVRVGLHSGEAELRGNDYHGVTVNRAARIRSLGHGGQILLSETTADLARRVLPEGVSLRGLGAHHLKGLAQPEQIWQVLHPALPAEFPPLASPAAHPSNLPMALTSFIGREMEQEEVRALLGEARLVTLTGAGGAGKTRLALQVADAVLSEYPEGVWLVELASLAGPALVPQAMAAALGLREEAGRSLQETLLAHLKEKHALLVLDNCEHLILACANLAAALLRGCPQLRILATSREGLGVAGERLYRVPSLSVPHLDQLPRPEGLGEYAAVALFVTRAQERRADFALTPRNARAVAAVCARLDGMPLALELAAARVGSLPVEAIAARLDDRFRLLTGGPRAVLPRQQTLRAALDWSYDLLSEQEQVLLQRLSVFAGGWTLEAVEVVCSGAGVEAWEVLDLLGSLVNKSLVLLEEEAADREQGRYRLLETVRQYGGERLAGGEEAAAVRGRHLGWCLALAEEARPTLTGPEQGRWLDRLETEHDNLRAAMRWCSGQQGEAAARLRLTAALWRFWYMRGYLSEGRDWLEAALAGDTSSPSAVRSDALNGAGNLAWAQGEYGRAAALHEEALALRRALGDTLGIAISLGNLGNVAAWRGEYERAAVLQEEALALFRELGDKQGIANSLGNLGLVAAWRGEYEHAAARQEESLALCRELGHTLGIASSLNNLGHVAHARGEYERAAVLQEEALALLRELGDKHGIADSLVQLGWVAHARGEYGQAAALFAEALQLSRAIGAQDVLVEGLEGLAQVAAARKPSLAARLGGAAEALRETLGVPLPLEEQASHDREVEAMRVALGEEAFDTVWAEGRALPLEETMALALESPALPEE